MSIQVHYKFLWLLDRSIIKTHIFFCIIILYLLTGYPGEIRTGQSPQHTLLSPAPPSAKQVTPLPSPAHSNDEHQVPPLIYSFILSYIHTFCHIFIHSVIHSCCHTFIYSAIWSILLLINLSYDGGGGLYVPPSFYLFFFTKYLSPRPNP